MALSQQQHAQVVHMISEGMRAAKEEASKELESLRQMFAQATTDQNAKNREFINEVTVLKAAAQELVSQAEKKQADTMTEIANTRGAVESAFGQYKTEIMTNRMWIEENRKVITEHKTSIDQTMLELKTASVNFDGIRVELNELKREIGEGRRGGGGGGGPGGSEKLGGFLPWKSMTPKIFGDREEGWRDWVEEVREYLDVVRPGMKALSLQVRWRSIATPMWSTSSG